MRKNSFLLVVMLFVALSLGFVSCDFNNESTPNDNTEQNGTIDNNEGIFEPIINYPLVDLGLSVIWAGYNVGAKSPEEYGDYFAWGEVAPKEIYGANYFDTTDGCETYLKYNNNGGKTILEATDDAATVNMGGSWRMPTKEEIEELIDGCTWEFTLKNDVKVCIGTSKINGNSICFPLAGIRTDGEEIRLDFPVGGYWSSSLDTSDDDCAEGIYFGWDGDDTEVESGDLTTRYMGASIRGVCK